MTFSGAAPVSVCLTPRPSPLCCYPYQPGTPCCSCSPPLPHLPHCRAVRLGATKSSASSHSHLPGPQVLPLRHRGLLTGGRGGGVRPGNLIQLVHLLTGKTMLVRELILTVVECLHIVEVPVPFLPGPGSHPVHTLLPHHSHSPRSRWVTSISFRWTFSAIRAEVSTRDKLQNMVGRSFF